MPNQPSDKIFNPPVAVQKACREGLALKETHGGRGLRDETLSWAEHFCAKKANDPHQAKRMRAWFHRHQVDRKEGWNNPPTPGYVAWQLWGGDAGLAWVEKIMAQVESEESKPATEPSAGRTVQKTSSKKASKKARAAASPGTEKKAKKAPGAKPAARKKAKKKTPRKKTVAKKS